MADDSEAIWRALEELRRENAAMAVKFADKQGESNLLLQRFDDFLAAYQAEALERAAWRKAVEDDLRQIRDVKGAGRVILWILGFIAACGEAYHYLRTH